MCETEGTTPTPDCATPAPANLVVDPDGILEPREYARHQELRFRPLRYDDEDAHPVTEPCPAWCRVADDPSTHTSRASRPMSAHHVSDLLFSVASRYRGERDEGGTVVATVASYLVRDTGCPVSVNIELNAVDRPGGEWQRETKLSLSLDDAQELAIALQHLIAQANAAEILAACE